jgi:hypothetical protein
MNRASAKTTTAAFVLLVISAAALAHHGTSRYDLEKTVTGFDWGNPHCLVHMDVKADNGEIQHWTLELASPFTMSHAGWNKDSLKLGDELVADTHPARNGISLGISATSKNIMKFVVNGKSLSTP